MNMDSYQINEEDSLNKPVLKYGIVHYHTLDHQYACHADSANNTFSLDDRKNRIGREAAIDANSILSRHAGELARWKKESNRLKQLVNTQLDLIQIQNEVIVKTEKDRRLLKLEYECLKANLHRVELSVPSNPTPVTHPPRTIQHIANPVVQNSLSHTPAKFDPRSLIRQPVAPINAMPGNRPLLRPTHYKSILRPMKPVEIRSQVRQPSKTTEPKIPSPLTKDYTYLKMLPNKPMKSPVANKSTVGSQGPNNNEDTGSPAFTNIANSHLQAEPIRMETKTEPRTNLIENSKPTVQNSIFKSRSQSYDKRYTKPSITKTDNVQSISSSSTNNVPPQSMLYTGSLSDRLRLIDTTPTGEDPYQIGEAEMREQSPIPKLMLKKTNQGRLRIRSGYDVGSPSNTTTTSADTNTLYNSVTSYDTNEDVNLFVPQLPSTSINMSLDQDLTTMRQYVNETTTNTTYNKKCKPTSTYIPPTSTTDSSKDDVNMDQLDWTIANFGDKAKNASLRDFAYGQICHLELNPDLPLSDLDEMIKTEPLFQNSDLDMSDDCSQPPYTPKPSCKKVCRTKGGQRKVKVLYPVKKLVELDTLTIIDPEGTIKPLVEPDTLPTVDSRRSLKPLVELDTLHFMEPQHTLKPPVTWHTPQDSSPKAPLRRRACRNKNLVITDLDQDEDYEPNPRKRKRIRSGSQSAGTASNKANISGAKKTKGATKKKATVASTKAREKYDNSAVIYVDSSSNSAQDSDTKMQSDSDASSEEFYQMFLDIENIWNVKANKSSLAKRRACRNKSVSIVDKNSDDEEYELEPPNYPRSGPSTLHADATKHPKTTNPKLTKDKSAKNKKPSKVTSTTVHRSGRPSRKTLSDAWSIYKKELQICSDEDDETQLDGEDQRSKSRKRNKLSQSTSRVSTATNKARIKKEKSATVTSTVTDGTSTNFNQESLSEADINWFNFRNSDLNLEDQPIQAATTIKPHKIKVEKPKPSKRGKHSTTSLHHNAVTSTNQRYTYTATSNVKANKGSSLSKADFDWYKFRTSNLYLNEVPNKSNTTFAVKQCSQTSTQATASSDILTPLFDADSMSTQASSSVHSQNMSETNFPDSGKLTTENYQTTHENQDSFSNTPYKWDVNFFTNWKDMLAKTSNANAVEVPQWRVNELEPWGESESKDGIENLTVQMYKKIHAKHELEEKRQLRWHLRCMREQKRVEKLKHNKRNASPSVVVEQSDVDTLLPDALKHLETIEITDTVPVSAFGSWAPDSNDSLTLPTEDNRPLPMSATPQGPGPSKASGYPLFSSGLSAFPGLSILIHLLKNTGNAESTESV